MEPYESGLTVQFAHGLPKLCVSAGSAAIALTQASMLWSTFQTCQVAAMALILWQFSLQAPGQVLSPAFLTS